MFQITYVRPDRVMRTSVLEPTAEGYQPVSEAQAVANRFTQVYGPTVWGWKGTRTVPGLLGGNEGIPTFARESHQMGPDRPGAVPVTHGFQPQFNRRAQAANRLLYQIDAVGPQATPNASVYMPIRAGARWVVPTAAGQAARLTQQLTPGPQIVAVRGSANALNAFRRTGRYY